MPRDVRLRQGLPLASQACLAEGFTGFREMKQLLGFQGFLTFLLCAFLAGCSGASWRTVEIDSPYKAPQALSVAVVGPRAAPDTLQTFSQELVDQLAARGIRAFVAPPAAAADANVTIVKWDPGSRGTRWLVGFGAGKGEIVIEVQTLGVQGVAEGWVSGGFFGGSSDNAVTAAADLIADTIASGLDKGAAAPQKNGSPRSKVGAR